MCCLPGESYCVSRGGTLCKGRQALEAAFRTEQASGSPAPGLLGGVAGLGKDGLVKNVVLAGRSPRALGRTRTAAWSVAMTKAPIRRAFLNIGCVLICC